jgi:hypothetical protein
LAFADPGTVREQLNRHHQEQNLDLKIRQQQYLRQHKELPPSLQQRLERQSHQRQLQQKRLQERQRQQIQQNVPSRSDKIRQNIEMQRFRLEQREQQLHFKMQQQD